MKSAPVSQLAPSTQGNPPSDGVTSILPIHSPLESEKRMLSLVVNWTAAPYMTQGMC